MGAVIANPTSLNTTISEMNLDGDYIVNLSATDSNSNVANDQLTITKLPFEIIAKKTAENGTVILGNSIESDDYGVGWPSYMASQLGVTINNLAVSSTASFKNIKAYFAEFGLGLQHPLFSMFGFNNVRINDELIKESYIELTLSAHRALLSSIFGKAITFAFDGATNPSDPAVAWDGISLTEGWTTANTDAELLSYNSRTLWFRTNEPSTHGPANMAFKTSVSPTDEVNIYVNGKDFAFGTWGCHSSKNLSKIEIYLDGELYTTYNPNNRCYLTGSGEGIGIDGFMVDSVIIKSAAEGSHQIKLKFPDTGRPAMFEYLITLKTPEETNLITECAVMFGDYILCSEEPNVGYNYPGSVASKAIIDEANERRQLDWPVQFAGHPILRIPTNETYFPVLGTTVNSDGIHPNTTGGQIIGDTNLFYTT